MASVNKITIVDSAMTAATNTSNTLSLEQKQTDLLAHVSATAVNGATTVTAKLQHSPDGGTTWYDLVTFANIVGASGAELKEITSAVLPLVRAHVVLAGTTKAATVKVDLFYDKA